MPVFSTCPRDEPLCLAVSVVRVREQLAEHRRAGLPFDAAWPATMRALPATEREVWAETLEATAHAWEAAYHRLPATQPERALSAAGGDPEREIPTGQADPWERACQGCGGPIGAHRQRNAVYCGCACQRAVYRERVAA